MDDLLAPLGRPAADGRRQRHPRLVLRRRPLGHAPRPPIAHGLRAARRGRRPARHRRRVDPPRRHPAAASPRSSTGCVPVIERSPRPGRVVSVDTMRAEVAEAALSRPGRGSSTTSPAAWPTPRSCAWWPASGAPYVAMHWRAHSDQMQRARDVRPATWSATYATSSAERVEAALGGRHRRGPARARPGARLRQDRRAQLGSCSRGLDELAALGLPLLVGVEPQVVPRAACSPTTGGPASGRRARGRQRGADHAAGRSEGSGASGCTRCAPARDALPRSDCRR